MVAWKFSERVSVHFTGRLSRMAQKADHLVGVDRDLAAEPAAHLGGDDPYLVFRHAGYQRAEEAGDVRVLAGAPDGQFAHGTQPARHRRARLHGVGHQALLDDGVANDYVGLGEGRVGVATDGYPVESLVVGGVLVKLRRAFRHRRHGVDHGGQRLVADVDQLQRVLSLVAGLRHHHGNGVALVAHHVLGDGRVGHGLHVGFRRNPGAGDGRQRALGVRAGVDRDDAGRGRGGGCVDASDASVSMGAAQDGGVHHAGQDYVVGVGRAAGYEARVLTAADA